MLSVLGLMRSNLSCRLVNVLLCILVLGEQTIVFTFPYAINNQVLPVIDCVADLGVMYDNHLSFVPHINKTVNKASQPANLIIRCFTTRDPLVLIKAFNTFGRPLLEYMPRSFGARLLKYA